MKTEEDFKTAYYCTFSEVMKLAKSRGICLPDTWAEEYSRLMAAYVEARWQQQKYRISIKSNAYLIEFLFKILSDKNAEDLIELLVLGKPTSDKR